MATDIHNLEVEGGGCTELWYFHSGWEFALVGRTSIHLVCWEEMGLSMWDCVKFDKGGFCTEGHNLK